MLSHNPLLESALLYARAGFRVFPCRPGQKEPVQGIKWVQEATNHLPQVEEWWGTRRPITPGANIGVVADHRLILDIDRKPGKPDGCETLRDYLPLPVTPTVATPNGGWHFYFKVPDDWQPKRRSGPGFDVQFGNAYVLAPPSRLGPAWLGKEPYSWVRNYWVGTVDLALLPESLGAFLGQAPERAPSEPDAGRPELLSQEEVSAIWPTETMSWPDRLRTWWDEGRVVEYASQSEAIHALTWQLFQGSLGPQQVLSVMWEHGWTQGVAREHWPANPVGWLWLSVKKLLDSRRPSAEEVFEAQAGEDTEAVYTALYARVKALREPNTPETLRELAAVLAEGQRLPEVARALLATLVGDANLGMTRKQAENVLSPPRKRKPSGSGQTNPALAELKNFIWIGPMDRFYDTGNSRLLTKHAITQQYAHLASEQQSPEEVVAEVLRQERVKYEGLTFRPDLAEGPVQEEDGLKWNIYRGLALEPVEGDWSPYIELFGHMGIDPADRDHILDYFAWMLQHPGERVRHALVIGGRGQGTGKDTLLVPLKMALGRRHVHELKSRNIYARFNGYMLDKRLIVVQEAHQESSAQSRMLEQHLKPFFTADEIEVEQKGIDPFMVRNYAHWVITTNEPHPLHISAGDRRYAMVRVPLEYATEDERSRWEPYWRGLYEWFRGGGAQYVLWELMRRDLSHFSPNLAPRSTVWHQEVIEMGLTEEETLVRDALEEEVGVLGWDFFTLDHAWLSVKARFPHQLRNGRPIARWDVHLALKRFGYTDHRMRFMVDGVRHQFRVWTQRLDVLKSRNPEAHWRIYRTRAEKVPELQGGGVTFLPVNSDESSPDDEDSDNE